MKNYSYLNFGLLLLVLPAGMLINELKPKNQEIDFISDKASLANSKLYVKGFINGLDTFHFNRYNHEEAFLNNDTIDIGLTASLLRLNIEIKDSQFTASIMEMSCMPPRKKLRIIRQRLELMPFAPKHGERLKGNYYCTARYYDEDVHPDSVVIAGYFDLQLFQL